MPVLLMPIPMPMTMLLLLVSVVVVANVADNCVLVAFVVVVYGRYYC